MAKFLRIIKIFVGVIVLVLLAGFWYLYSDEIKKIAEIIYAKARPCDRPITYVIGTIDPRFGLTKAEAQSRLKEAEMIWEEPIVKNLFEYSETGVLKINFIYDERQQATDDLKKIGLVIDDSRSAYEALKARQDQMTASYNKEKAKLDKMIAVLKTDQSSYEKDIAYWNARGGAPKMEYTLLENKRTNLNNQVAAINQEQESLNKLAGTINSANIVLNKMIDSLNLKINKYNTIGSGTGKEFREGVYTLSGSEQSIDVFQFNDKDKLVRLLAHEFGHALGLEHASDPKAIMYYLNEGEDENFSAADLAALKAVCEIK